MRSFVQKISQFFQNTGSVSPHADCESNSIRHYHPPNRDEIETEPGKDDVTWWKQYVSNQKLLV